MVEVFEEIVTQQRQTEHEARYSHSIHCDRLPAVLQLRWFPFAGMRGVSFFFKFVAAVRYEVELIHKGFEFGKHGAAFDYLLLASTGRGSVVSMILHRMLPAQSEYLS